MNQQFDRAFLEWLHDGPETGPAEAMARAAEAVHQTRQRPGWATRERWRPIDTVRLSNSQRLALLAAVAALLIAGLVGALLLAGATPKTKPLGGNGAIVVDVGSTLWRVEPDGSSPTALPIGLGHAYSPTFSPDGTRLAFLSRSGNDGPFSIFVSGADGTGAVNVTGAMEVQGDQLASLAWAPDNSRIVFAAHEGGIDVLYSVGADGADLRQLVDGQDSRTSPTISPDGRWLAYQLQTVRPLQSSLVVSRANGGEARTLLSVDHINPSFRGSQWAPDSTRLAYFRKAPIGHAVGIVDLAGRETLVSPPGEDAVNPAWSPDGKFLVYATGASGAVVVEVATGSRRPIPPGLADCGATWAPDGTAILGLGASCTDLFWIPLADPAAAVRVPVPSGVINIATWQQVAP